MVDEWWPELGRMHVADGEKTGQPEWDSGLHSQAIMGRHEYYCALLSNSPKLFTKGWPAHTKYQSDTVTAVTAAATVLCAK